MQIRLRIYYKIIIVAEGNKIIELQRMQLFCSYYNKASFWINKLPRIELLPMLDWLRSSKQNLHDQQSRSNNLGT